MGGCLGKQRRDTGIPVEELLRESAALDRALTSGRSRFVSDLVENPDASENQFEVYHEIVIDRSGIIQRINRNQNLRAGRLNVEVGQTLWDGLGIVLRGEMMDYRDLEPYVKCLSKRSQKLVKIRYKRIPAGSNQRALTSTKSSNFPVYATLVPVFENPNNKRQVSHFVVQERVDFS